MAKSLNRTMPAFRSLEINFHQKQASKLPVEKIAIVTLLFFSLFGFGWLGWLGVSAGHAWGATNLQLTQINSQIETAAAANKAGNAEESTSSQLLALPALIRSGRIETTAMLDKLAPLIPYEANITSLSFGEDGSIINVIGLFASTEAVISFEQAIRGSADFKLLTCKRDEQSE